MIRFVLTGLAVSASLPLLAGDAVAKSYPPIIRSALAVAVDGSGNKYVGGSFSETLDLNPAKGMDLRTSAGGINQYFIRLDANGNYNWSQQFGGSGEDRPDGNGQGQMRFAVANGVLYIVTSFASGDAALGVSSGTGPTSPQAATRVASRGDSDVAIIALSVDTGAPVPAFGGDGIVTFGGAGTDTSRTIVVDGGTVYVAGNFSSADAGIDGFGLANSTGGDIYILALDALSGAPRIGFGNNGVRVFGEPGGSERCGELAISGSNLFLAGIFGGTTGTPSAGGNDGFVACLDAASGQNVFSFSIDGIQSFGGSDVDGASGVAAGNGIVYVSGSFRSNDFGIGGAGSFTSTGISDAFIAALNATDGTPYTTFGVNGVVRFGGSDGSETFDSLRLQDNVLYAGGYGSATAPRLDGAPNDFERRGFFDTYLLAINSFTGAPLTSFGGGDALLSLGGRTFITQNESLPGTFNFGRDLAVWKNKVVQVGSTQAKDATIDDMGPFDGTGFGGFIIEANTVFDVKPPIFAEPNPTRPGTLVTLTVTGPVAVGTVTWNFGDGSPAQNGNPITHVFNGTVDTTFTVSATSTGGVLTLPVRLVVPNVPNQANIGDGVTVMAPLDGLSIKLNSSEGGVLEFLTDVSTLRANEDVITKVTLGDTTDVIPTRLAIFKAKIPGIVLADSIAKEGGTQRGRVRKMAAVSSREVGASNALPAAPDKNIVIDSLAGKFLFTSQKADSVTFKGKIQLPAGLDLSAPDGVEIFVGIGNVIDRLTVSSKGKGAASDLAVVKKAAVKFPRLKDTTVTAGGELASLQVQFSLANLDEQGFDTEGITAQLRSDEQGAKSVQRSIQIALVIAGVSYEAQAPVDFKLSSKGDSGQIKGRKAN